MEDLYQMGKEVAVVGLDGQGRADIIVIDPIKVDTDQIENKKEESKELPSLTDYPEAVEETTKEDSGSMVTTLDGNLAKLLKLKAKPIIRGRPKGKRDQGKRMRPKEGECSSGGSGDEDEDDPGNHYLRCTSCEGPVVCKTSHTKKNYRRKYIVCASQKIDSCKIFHSWLTTKKSDEIKEEKPQGQVEGKRDEQERRKDDSTEEGADNVLPEKNTKFDENEFSHLLDEDDNIFGAINEPSLNREEEPTYNFASTPTKLCEVVNGFEKMLKSLDKGDNFEAPITSNIDKSPYYCSTCGNTNLEKKAIMTDGPNFGREWYGCFLESCLRPKPFVIWAPTKENQLQSKKCKNSNSTPKKNLKNYFDIVSSSAKCCSCGISDKMSPLVCCKECAKTVHSIMPCSFLGQYSNNSATHVCSDCNRVTLRKRKFEEDSRDDNKKSKSGSSTLFTCEVLTPTNMPCLVENHTITLSDINSLEPGSWLNDKIIDCFVDLMTNPDNLYQSEAKIFRLHSLALECASMGVDSIINMAETKYLLFNDLWLVPTHVNGNHWVLLLVLVKKKVILILDPINSNALSAKDLCNDLLEQLQILRLMIDKSHRQCYGEPVNWDCWKICAPQDLSTQTNTSDCGVFVCMWVYNICTGAAAQVKNSLYMRAYSKNLILKNATALPISKPFVENDGDSIEFVNATYREFDQKVQDGLLVIEKPWRALSQPHIDQLPQDMVSAGNYLSSILNNLWIATEEECGASVCKKSLGDMYFCEWCREYYHKQCVRDYGLHLAINQFYLCPKHRSQPQDNKMTSVGKRNRAPPLRIRKSLS